MQRTILLSLTAAALVVLAIFAGRGMVPGREAGTTNTPDTTPKGSAPRSRASTGSPVKLSVALSGAYILQASDGRVDLAVEVAAQKEQQRARIPINISLVLDRSGSMAGEKLSHARQAAREMIKRLSGEDRMSLIAYDSTVDVMVPSVSLAEGRARLLAAVERIVDRGGTNLGAGLSRGIEELRRTRSDRFVHRVILISDGRANEGVTDPGTLNAWSEEARRGSISISTMGVGLDYNEDLMMALADHGGGSYHYIRDSSALARIFNQELDSLFATVAKGMVLEVQPAPGVSAEKVYGYPAHRESGLVRVPLGDLPAGDQRIAVLGLVVPSANIGLRSVAQVRLSYQNTLAKGRMVHEGLGVELSVSADPAQVAQGEDRLAQEQAHSVRAQEVTHQAMDLYRSGRVEEARSMARDHANILEQVARRLRSEQVRQESQILLQLDEEIAATPAASSRGGKGLLKKTKARAWKKYRKKGRKSLK